MNEKKDMTRKQKYLQFLLPSLDDGTIDKMIAVAMEKKKKQESACHSSDMDPYAKLRSMVGCENAKKQLDAMIANFRMRQIAQARGRSSARAYYHAAFIGNPGCAKTTCARLFAKVLAREGITKSDLFGELSRSDLVGQYMGATALKVREVFKKYKGGVILIDEAYSLSDDKGGSNNSFGREAINEMIVCLENDPETVVIFSGYPDRMKEFLESNPGLVSRVPYRVVFEDYTTEELVEISKVMAEEQGYMISEAALVKLSEIYESAKSRKDFGNGRYVRNVVEAAIRTKGIRLGVMENQDMSKFSNHLLYTDEELFSLDESCFEVKQEPPGETCRKIGFCS